MLDAPLQALEHALSNLSSQQHAPSIQMPNVVTQILQIQDKETLLLETIVSNM